MVSTHFYSLDAENVIKLNIEMPSFNYAVSKMKTMIKLYGIHYLPTAIYILLEVRV